MVSFNFAPFKADSHSQDTQIHTACTYTEALTYCFRLCSVMIPDSNEVIFSLQTAFWQSTATLIELRALQATLPNCAMRKQKEAVFFWTVKKTIWKLIRHIEECKDNFSCEDKLMLSSLHLIQFKNKLEEISPNIVILVSVQNLCKLFKNLPLKVTA